MTTKEKKKYLIDFIKNINHEQFLEIEINYGIRDAIPGDDNYCDWAVTKKHNGGFYLTVKGSAYR